MIITVISAAAQMLVDNVFQNIIADRKSPNGTHRKIIGLKSCTMQALPATMNEFLVRH
ncbi:MAG: hypothetical protein ACTHMM_26230 [Agriterribacter sp.]